MKSLSCADLGMKDCSFKAEGSTEQEVIDKTMEHAMSAHAGRIGKMDRGKLMSMMQAKIQEA